MSRPRDDWWRHAVIYQIYPRSFMDSDGDGIGDLRGVTARLPAVHALGVDAVWLSPFYPSPQIDAGYDVADYRDVDPLLGTLADFDDLLERAHELGLRVIVDLVPNHTSDRHAWFREALAAAPGSPQRARYIFRDGRGPAGELPPNNWESMFGGPAWDRVIEADGRPGQWYLHLFDASQPDLDWTDPTVRREFEDILRFWLDRGVDGFRVDVAHGLAKADGLPDRETDGSGDSSPHVAPYWGQPAVHEIYRDWRRLLAGYDGDRVLCAEAWAPTLGEMALWVRPDEMHQAFNFVFLETPWEIQAVRSVIDESLAAFQAVGAPATWVLSNHDVIRHATRLALDEPAVHGNGIGPASGARPDVALGLRRARAATALMLGLPGSAYLYQGEELGLPEVIDIPDEARQDPTWRRSGGERYGRDGCRVPLPWTAEHPSYGFSAGDTPPWLPQPADWARYARENQQTQSGSTLDLYLRVLALRREYALGSGAVEWGPASSPETLAFTNRGVTVLTHFGPGDIRIPRSARILLSSGPVHDRVVTPDTTVWYLDPTTPTPRPPDRGVAQSVVMPPSTTKVAPVA